MRKFYGFFKHAGIVPGKEFLVRLVKGESLS